MSFRVLKTTGILTSGRIISAASQMVLFLLFTSRAGKTEAGTTLWLVSVTVMLAGISDFGLATLLFNSSILNSKERVTCLLRAGMAFNTIVCICIGLVWAVTAVIEGFGFPTGALLLLVWAYAEHLVDLVNAVEIGRKKYLVSAASIGFRRVAALALYLVTVKLNCFPINSVTFGTVLLIPSGVVLLARSHMFMQGVPNKISMKNIIAESRGFALSTWGNQLRLFDISIISLALGAGASASYSLSSRLANPVLIVFSSLGSATISQGTLRNNSQVNKVVAIFILVSAVIPAFVYGEAELLTALAKNWITWVTIGDIHTFSFIIGRYFLLGGCLVLGARLDFRAHGSLSGSINLFFSLIGLAVLVPCVYLTGNIAMSAFVMLILAFAQICTLNVASQKVLK